MPSVAFVISYLLNGADAESPDMLAKWRVSREIHESWFNSSTPRYPLTIYAGYEDPAFTISAGPWSCPEEHYEEFAVSEEMMETLEEFGDVLELAGSFHMDMTWDAMPSESKFLAIGRYWVDAVDKEAFEAVWTAYQPTMEKVCGGRIAAGWKIKGGWQDTVAEDHADKAVGVKIEGRQESAAKEFMAGDEDDDEREQWVCCMGWADEERMKFVMSQAGAQANEKEKDWDGLVDIVKLSKKMTNHYLKRIDYDNGEEEGVQN